MKNVTVNDVDKLFHQITDLLPFIYDCTDEEKFGSFTTNEDGDTIYSSNQNEIDVIANLFDQLYGGEVCDAGDCGLCDGEPDVYTGLYYVTIS